MKYFAYLEQQSKQAKATIASSLPSFLWSSAPEPNPYIYGKPLPPYKLANFWGMENFQQFSSLEKQAADLYHGSQHAKNILVAAKLYINAAEAALKYTKEAEPLYKGLSNEIEIRNFLLHSVSQEYDLGSGAFEKCITRRGAYEAFHPFTYLPDNYEYQPFAPLPPSATYSSLQTMFEPFFDTWIRAASFGLLVGAWRHMELKISRLSLVNVILRQSYPRQATMLIEATLNKAGNQLHAPAMILLQLHTLALNNLQADLCGSNPPNLDIVSINFYLQIMKFATRISEELYVIEDYVRQISAGDMELAAVLPKLRAISNNLMNADLFEAEEFIAIDFIDKFVKGQLTKQHQIQEQILFRMRELGYGRILDALGVSNRKFNTDAIFDLHVSYARKQQEPLPSTLKKRRPIPGGL